MSEVKAPNKQAIDAALLLGWITGLILIAGLCWFFTQPVRDLFLLNAVNRSLEQSGDSRRLKELYPAVNGQPRFAGAVPSGQAAGFGIGTWYSIADCPENSFAFVFTFVGGGFFFPCIAVLSQEGRVQEFIPLGSHGERMMRQVSPGILRLYTRRIEGAKL